MEPTTYGTDDMMPLLGTEGDSVPWTPSDILAADIDAGGSVAPFVVQAGATIWMLERDERGWTLAELQFHTRYGFYQERRRATYRWPREAFGAMLSRLVAADLEMDVVSGLTLEFCEWVGARLVSPVGRCQVPC